MKKITIKEVAKKAGFSITTVSMILNGKTELFPESTIEKVLEAKDFLNYQPSSIAQQMLKKKSNLIGVIVSDLSNPFFTKLVQGINQCLFDNDYMMILGETVDEDKKYKFIQELDRRNVDGVISASSAIESTSLRNLFKEKKIPSVVLDQTMYDGTMDAILTDDISGGKIVAKYLYQMGHRKVIVLRPEKMTINIENRFRSFKSIFLKCGTGEASIQTMITDLSMQGGYQFANQIVSSEATAVFCLNDELAIGLYAGLKEFNKRIPEDFSIVGYDNIETTKYLTPPLTTISQPVYDLGVDAAKILIENIDNENKMHIKKVLPVKLIERNSVAHLI